MYVERKIHFLFMSEPDSYLTGMTKKQEVLILNFVRESNILYLPSCFGVHSFSYSTDNVALSLDIKRPELESHIVAYLMPSLLARGASTAALHRPSRHHA
jgi:hypothetical protein